MNVFLCNVTFTFYYVMYIVYVVSRCIVCPVIVILLCDAHVIVLVIFSNRKAMSWVVLNDNVQRRQRCKKYPKILVSK